MIKKQFDNNGILRFEYEVENEKKHGLYKEYYENGQLKVETIYKNGERDGLYKEYYQNRNIKFEFYYKGYKKYGLCKMYYENGQLMSEENYEDGEKYGLSRRYYENGQLRIEEQFKAGKKDGVCKKYYETGQLKVEGNYRNGKEEGLWITYYETGQLKYKDNYKEGYLHGLQVSYNENGKIQNERGFKNGVWHGIHRRYYFNGQLELESNYENGEKEGIYKGYYENGKLKSERYYKNGKRTLLKEYDINGKLKFENYYKNGKPKDFLCKKYNENGMLEEEYNNKDYKIDGIYKVYYEDGNLAAEHNFEADKRNGLSKKYYKNGKLEFENYYKNDRREFGKKYEYSIENNQEITKINYYICDKEDNEIIYQEDSENTTLNIITRKNYIILNRDRFCLSEKLIDNKKELQTINDNIKLKVDNHYVDLDKKYYKTIYSYEDIIAEIEIPNKEIFLEREFIRDRKLNGLKVLYKKNNETKEYINAQLYENNIKIKDNIEDRRRLINQYFISNEEKEEWINIPFIEDPNYISKNSNKNIENLETSNNKALYTILPIIGVLVLGVILYFVFFKENNDYQEVSTQSVTSYSQPKAQQEVVKSTVVENSYIPTVEDARYINYKTYYNDYYDYSIDYPDDEYFQISKTYEDGMKLQNDNGEVIISLTSNWNPNGESLQQAYDKAVREKPNAAYKFLGKTFFTITYEDNGLLIFRKTMYDKDTNKYVYLYVSFPPEYKPYMTPIVERMANSMKKSVSNVTSTANNSYSDSQFENKFGRVVKDKYVGGSFIEFLRNADENEYYYLRDQFWEILDTMYVTEDNKTYYYLNDIIDQLETKADWDNSSRVISLEVKGNKMYYTVGFPKGYNANTPSWVQFEIFERKFNDGIGLRTAHVSCAINGVEYKDWDAVYAIFR